MRLTDAEWAVMEVLWERSPLSLGEITDALRVAKAWNKNTVHTYLTRMEKKGLVTIDHSRSKPYGPAVSRDACASRERSELLHKVYNGAAGDLIAAFLKESPISREEANRLRSLLDQMEV